MSVRVSLSVPAELVAEIGIVNTPACPDGVPESVPVDVLPVSPAGTPVNPYDVGLLVAVI